MIRGKYVCKSARYISIFTAIILTTFIMLAGCVKGDEEAATTSSKTPINTAAKTSVKSAAASMTKIAALPSGSTNLVLSLTVAVSDNTGTIIKTEGVSDTDTKTVEGENTENEEQTDSNDSPLIGDVKEETYNLNGRIIRYATPNLSYTYDFFKTLNEEFNMWTKRIDYAEKKYNCKIEIVPYAATTFLNNLVANAIAGTYWTDITMFGISYILQHHYYVQSLDQWIDYTSPKLSINPGQKDLEYGGKHYCVQIAYKINGDYFILYNKDIISREGLPDILELQSNNQWTWNSLTDIANKATRDTNGDGITDQWGLTTQQSAPLYLRALIASNGSTIIKEVNGSYVSNLGDPKSLKAIYLCNDLQNVYKCANISAISKLYQQGISAMTFADITGVRTTITTYPQNSCYAIYPQGPDADGYLINHRGGWAASMPYMVEMPEIVARMIYDINAVYDDSYPDYLAEPDVRKSYENYVFSESDYATLELAKSLTLNGKMVFDPYEYMATLDSLIFTGADSFYQTVLKKNVPVQTSLEISKNIISEELEKLVAKYKFEINR